MLKMSRREFLRNSSHIAASAIVVRYLHGNDALADSILKMPFSTSDDAPNNIGRQRYEGAIKVRGQKIFGIDFRAKDLRGWPTTERRSVILRSNTVDKIFNQLNVSDLRKKLGVSGLVTGDDLAAWGCRGGEPFLMPELYVKSNSLPSYLGQPIALITFPSIAHYLSIKDKLRNLADYLNFGDEAVREPRNQYGATRFVRYLGPFGEEEFSFIKDGPFTPSSEGASRAGTVNARALHYIQKIKEETATSGWLSLEGSYCTQCVDPMFMEPESGLSWFDSRSQTLSLTLGTQSPHDDAIAILDFFQNASNTSIKKIVINCCYPGGGFGGRDSSDFPIHLAIAAIAEPDVSHRIVHTRFDQFQGGIKRHPSIVKINLSLDHSGRFQMLHSDIRLDGGGQNNYSFVVQDVAARNAGSGYHFPRALIDAVAYPSTAIPSGSMRGYGTFQSTFGLECLIDEAATLLKIDPIDLRLMNVIKGRGELISGVPLAAPIHATQVLEAAKRSPAWMNRNKGDAPSGIEPFIRGTGFALGCKTFGKGDDACMAGLYLEPSGTLKLMTSGVDMGNGSATTLPLSLAEVLGRPADEIQIGVSTEFDPLQLKGVEPKSEDEQLKLSQDPFWVPVVSMSTAASTTAFQLRHSVIEAGKIILEFGLWPAAAHFLGLKGALRQFDPQRITVNEAGLVYEDGRSVSFNAMAKIAHDMNLVTGVMVHAFYRTRWARATFVINQSNYSSEIDALALRYGNNDFRAVARSAVDFPAWKKRMLNANQMASYAVIVSVAINKATGKIQVTDASGFLECGRPTHQRIVEGQIEGAFAMGVGQALLEGFPSEGDGPGQGSWNLHLYQVPLARDCAIGRTQFTILPADSSNKPKGMSEVVFNPVPAAIINAVADATGIRFTRLPLTPADLIAALK